MLTTWPRPVTASARPSGDRRASTAPRPFLNGVLPISTSEPSRSIEWREIVADAVFTENR